VLDSIRRDVSLTPLQRDYKTVAHISAIKIGTATCLYVPAPTGAENSAID
jgi:hypothetical protein